MGLLKSVTDVPGIDFYDYRDDEYYGKYNYRVRFKLPGVRYAMYEKTVDDFLKRYHATTGWKKIRPDDMPIVTKNLQSIIQFVEFRNSLKDKSKTTIRVEGNSIAIFGNDLSLLKTVETIKLDTSYDYTQVQVSNFVGVKSFVHEPKHKYRVYLRSKKVEQGFAIQLNDLLNRSPNLYPSPSLKYWVKGLTNGTSPHWSWKYRFTNSSHFIDYDDESTLSYLALIHGELLGKRYKLEKRIENYGTN